MNNELKVGAVLFNSKPFTSRTGAHFAAGAEFEVLIVGTVSVQLRAQLCGSLVWLPVSAAV